MTDLGSKALVRIGEESYSIQEIPSFDSAVVKKEVTNLLGLVELDTLVTDLGRVGGFIRIAYNSIGAAGPKFTENQIAVQQLGFDVTRLCDKSAITVVKYMSASETILDNLKSTYEYLLSNFEEIAVETLTAVGKIAKDMEESALELYKEFNEQGEKVFSTATDTKRRQGKEQLAIDEMKKQRERMKKEKAIEEKLLNEAAEMEAEADDDYTTSSLQEDVAVQNFTIKDLGVIKNLTNAFTLTCFKRKAFKQESEVKVEHWRKKRIDALKKKEEARTERIKSLKKMTDFASKLKDLDSEENMADIAVKALHEAESRLKELALVMMQVANFWKLVQLHCQSLTGEEITRSIQTAIDNYSEKKRLEFWTMKIFKVKAIKFYARWVALTGVCSMYKEKIKEVQKDLHKYLKENPTCEESRQNVKALAEAFISDLKKDQKQITERSTETQEEIESLSNAKEDN